VSANSNQVRLLPKWVWVALCLVVPILGGILYLTLGRPVDGLAGGGSRGSFGRPSPTPRTTTIAPDDDPDFLRKLRDRLNRDDEQSGESEDPKDTPGGGPSA